MRPHTLSIARALSLFALMGATLISAAGCSQGSDASEVSGGKSGATGSTMTGRTSECSDPAPGCACSTDGQTSPCGTVISQEGTHVECSEGTTTCASGVWGACIGETTRSMELEPEPKLKSHILPTTPSTCTGDPCDPYCFSYTDPGSAYVPPPDSGIAFVDGGVTVIGKQVPVPACTSLTVTPYPVTITVTAITGESTVVYPSISATAVSGASAVSYPVQYTGSLNPSNCYTVAPTVVWSTDNPNVGLISNNGQLSVATPIGTQVHVTGYANGFSNSANPALVNIVVNAFDSAPLGNNAAPSPYNTAAAFSGAASVSDNITELYPYNNTVLPLGLLAPIIQWANGGTTANAVKVTLRYPSASTSTTPGSVFTWSGVMAEINTNPTPTLAGQPRAFIPQNVWSAFERTATGATADIVIQRIVGGTLRQPNAPINITFATGQLKGTVYYQSYGTNLLANSCCTKATGGNFGAGTLAVQPSATAPVVSVGTDNPTTGCLVCHSVAGGGSSIITQNGVPSSYPYTDWYTLSTQPASGEIQIPGASNQFAWGALSPDGNYMFTNFGSQFAASTSTPSGFYYVAPNQPGVDPYGTPIPTTGFPTGGLGAMTPQFSNDGNHIAFNFYWNGIGVVPTSLPGTFQTTLGSFTVTSSEPMNVIGPGATLVFSSGGVGYVAAVSGNTIILTTPYVGLTAANATAIFYTFPDQASLASIDVQYTPPTSLAGASANVGNMVILARPGEGGIPSGTRAYYPAYFPNNNQLAWELELSSGNLAAATSQNCINGASGSACTQDGTHAELWWTDVASATSAPLTQANGGTSDTSTYLPAHASAVDPTGDYMLNYEPTMDPVEVGGYYWMIFTSRRQYGNIATINPFDSDPRNSDLSAQPTPKKLWVAAINPNAKPGTDPSYPAFYLQGQELLAGNSRGYWVASACTPAGNGASNVCNTNADCCASDYCVEAQGSTTSYCQATSTPTCVPLAGACTNSNQCCSFPNNECSNGVCGVTPAPVQYSPTSFSVVYNGAQCSAAVDAAIGADASCGCPAGTHVSWIDVGLEGTTPEGTNGTYSSITIGVQISNTTSNYLPTTPATLGTMTGPPVNQSANWTNYPLSSTLDGISSTGDSDTSLKVTFTFNPSTDFTAVSSIQNWRARFDCVPSE